MSGPRPFGPDELDGVAGLAPDELAAETRLARDLEGIAARDGITASPGFTERVMGAIATEPLSAPAVAAGSALRRGALAGLLVSVRDAVRVSFSGGFPVAVRAQAFALVLLVAALTAGSGYGAAEALGLLDDRSSPRPSIETPSLPPATPLPTGTPDPTLEAPTRSPQPSPSPEATGDPSETPEATTPPTPTRRLTPTPTGTPEATDDHGGDDGDGDDDASGEGAGSGGPTTPAKRRTPTTTDLRASPHAGDSGQADTAARTRATPP